MSDLFERILNAAVERQLMNDPDFLAQEEAARAILVSSPDPNALALVDAYTNLCLHRYELGSLFAFRLGFELGQAHGEFEE